MITNDAREARPSAHKTTLLFDIGEVLIGWSMDPILEKLFPDPVARQAATPYFKQWNPEWDRGTLYDAMRRMQAAHPEYGEHCLEFFNNWIVGLGRVHEDTVEVARKLKNNGYRLLIASNWSADTFETGRPHMHFLKYFDGLHISGQIGKIKPDRDYFESMAERFGFSFGESVFIDDKQINTDAAQSFGIDSITFKSASQMARELQRFGIVCI